MLRNRFRKGLKLAGLIVALMTLWSCAQRQQPAPVTVINVSSADPVYLSVSGDQHTVQSGETLYSIAFRANIDFRRLADLNNITAPYLIHPGQILQLTSKSAAVSQQNQPKVPPKADRDLSQKNNKKVVDRKNKQEYVRSEQNVNKTFNNVSQYSNKVSQWQWPTDNKVTQGYSTKLLGNKGLDFAGNIGSPIRASASGKVVYAGNALRGYGNLVIIKHNDDYLSAYAHNDKLLVKEQQQVEAGQVIAQMGKSDTDTVKLHFEIRYRGKSVNPLKYLPKR